MGESNKAVFLSYASQDAAAAMRLCEALRRGGLEVWLDQSELRGGDAWDQRIRQQIRECTLFVPIISINTASRPEGYFRLEWDLADQRTHKIARNRPFIIPVCLDATANAGADVPESFQRVHWTRLPGGEAQATFVERISRLLSPGEPSPLANDVPVGATTHQPPAPNQRRRPKSVALLIALGLFLVGSFVVLDRLVLSKRDAPASATPIARASAAVPSAVAEKSIAVLPFVDMSERKDQEYFSDGLSEELIDLLAKTQGLEVIARTSSFYFKGKQVTIAEIAKTLNVANVMEGSVRKAGNTIRVTAQLIRASDGVHLWSETYDRDLKDVFKVQDEIAQGVVQKLRLTLLPVISIASARTVNSEAHSLYLQGRYFQNRDTGEDLAKANDYFKRALALDATYAPAWAGIATVATRQVANGHITMAKALVVTREAASKALELDPKNGEANAALGIAHMMAHEWAQAEATLASAREIDPTDSSVFMISGVLARGLGRDDDAIALFRQALEHDPLNLVARRYFARTLSFAGRLAEAEAEIRQVLDTNSAQPGAQYDLGRILVAKGQIDAAGAAFEAETDEGWKRIGLPLSYHALHRTAEANAAFAILLSKSAGAEFQLAETYADFGDADQSFKWLEAASQLDLGIIWLHNDPLFKDLTRDPRYTVVLRKLKMAQ
ncbi:MAG TPA: TIR domain-containing protein [Steroidobacteraceae bacterium]|nr:TIR domain-containing protein [Steroidobacteraceae bacterium]